ncbi:MAG: choice-of-anchor D domain-containing protein [Acidobacteriia bacterium]|nr:choice-of-anchor D domain-containing protein [Terriglobia bacterium]
MIAYFQGETTYLAGCRKTLPAMGVLIPPCGAACGGSGAGGGGGSSPPAPAPIVSFSPPSLTFGQAVTGSTSAFQSTLLSNTGRAILSISSITIGGANPPYITAFTETNTSGSSLAAGASCAINVTFTPPRTGPYSASLIITDNAYGGQQTVGLTGTGVTPPGSYSWYVGAQSGNDMHTLYVTVNVQ